jgi:general stress protein 26
MTQLRKSSYLILSILLLIPFIGISQNIVQKDSSNIKLVNAAREIMTAAGTCALITLDEEGRPRVRVMDPFLPESDLTVWFGTNPKSRKVDQIKKDPRVTIYYLDSDASGYVMIHGIAQIIDDQKEKEKHWKDEWEAFYPNSPEGYLLVKVSPKWMEIISYTRGIVGDHTTWQPPKVLFDSKQ